MPYCSECGFQMTGGETFCPNCGQGQEAVTSGAEKEAVAGRRSSTSKLKVLLPLLALLVAIVVVAVIVLPKQELGPGETLEAFFSALKEGRYVEASKFMSSQFIEQGRIEEGKDLSAVEIAEKFGQHVKRMGVERIEIVQEDISPDGKKAEVLTIAYFTDRREERDYIPMIKEDGRWKITYR
ncbi:DUF4878 domain-containing protein [Dehalococcoidia bacterium]|nr:DUF4878 domain-containing protein [Dehalococcoidia bacterium]